MRVPDAPIAGERTMAVCALISLHIRRTLLYASPAGLNPIR